MPLATTDNGRTNLQVWRGGRSYEAQKGRIYRREWNNLLFSVRSRPVAEGGVLYADVRQPLSYPEQTFDAVFLLHIVEHLTPQEAESLLDEVRRILKPSGRLRVSTPNLEDICRAYLGCLDEYDRHPVEANLIRYEWSVLELLDQIVRVRSGGLMVDNIKRGRYDRAYAEIRFGDVFDEFYVPQAGSAAPPRTLVTRVRQLTPQAACEGIYRRLKGLWNGWLSGGTEQLPADPRLSGEVNKWLYDRLSLAMLLEKTGFDQISQKTFRTSDIPEWERFELDRSTFDDHAIEPSLYMEARRPPIEAIGARSRA